MQYLGAYHPHHKPAELRVYTTPELTRGKLEDCQSRVLYFTQTDSQPADRQDIHAQKKCKLCIQRLARDLDAHHKQMGQEMLRSVHRLFQSATLNYISTGTERRDWDDTTIKRNSTSRVCLTLPNEALVTASSNKIIPYGGYVLPGGKVTQSRPAVFGTERRPLHALPV
jgi:hypothetical protein